MYNYFNTRSDFLVFSLPLSLGGGGGVVGVVGGGGGVGVGGGGDGVGDGDVCAWLICVMKNNFYDTLEGQHWLDKQTVLFCTHCD